MDNPKCKTCGNKTQWYGWIHGWLCVECDAEIVKAVEDEDTSPDKQQPEEPQKSFSFSFLNPNSPQLWHSEKVEKNT